VLAVAQAFDVAKAQAFEPADRVRILGEIGDAAPKVTQTVAARLAMSVVAWRRDPLAPRSRTARSDARAGGGLAAARVLRGTLDFSFAAVQPTNHVTLH
jgi:hypothetical protein